MKDFNELTVQDWEDMAVKYAIDDKHHFTIHQTPTAFSDPNSTEGCMPWVFIEFIETTKGSKWVVSTANECYRDKDGPIYPIRFYLSGKEKKFHFGLTDDCYFRSKKEAYKSYQEWLGKK